MAFPIPDNDSIRDTPKLGDVWLGTGYVVVEANGTHTLLRSAKQPNLSLQLSTELSPGNDSPLGGGWHFASAWHLFGKSEDYCPPESAAVSPVQAAELVIGHHFGEFAKEGKGPEVTVLGIEYEGHVIRSIELGEEFHEFLQRVVSSLEEIVATESKNKEDNKQ
jgi:hypothetical protein